METPANQERSPADQAAAGPGHTAGEPGRQTGSRPRGVFPPPRKLTDEQEREVTRLYAETPTPLAEIGRTYGISQTSVSRIAQRHGADLRQRTGARDERAALASRRGQPARDEVPAPKPVTSARGGRRHGRAAGSDREGRRRRTSPAPAAAAVEAAPTPAAVLAAAQTSGSSTRRRFRITFVAEQVIEADDMRDAIARAEALGATDITSIDREA